MCSNYILQRRFHVWIKHLRMAANLSGGVPECIVVSGMTLYPAVLHPGGMGWGGTSNRK